MKKLTLTLLMITILMLTGCGTREYYNKNDEKDFQYGNSIKFDIVQLKNVVDKDTLKRSNLDGGFFLFMGSVSGKSSEQTILTNTYYGYLKNKNGAIYFAEIPANKVRIYEDAEKPCIVAWVNNGADFIDVNSENIWDQYQVFNLHIPEGTIIPRVKLNFDIDSLK